jgi:deazaflavin-dependent oxidoreductase (nitroreductase family)
MSSSSDWNKPIIDEFRANGGKVSQFEGRNLLLLHTTGAKSGQQRVNPLAYQSLGDGRYAVFGSKAGAPTNPDWFHNLKANPRVKIEVGAQTLDATARVAEGEERHRIWEQQKQDAPGFADYETKTTRQIPVVILEPTS